MKINRLEAHDRLIHLKNDQSINISQGAENCLKKNSLSIRLQQKSPYIYLFAHPRTCDDGVTKKMWWQPRLTKPSVQTNSYLFRARSNTDILEICWILPPQEMWNQYKKGNITEHEWVLWSIYMYKNHRQELERPFLEDFSDDNCKRIYKEIAEEIESEKRMDKIYNLPSNSEEFIQI